MKNTTTCCLILLCFMAGSLEAAPLPPFSAQDLVSLQRVSEVAVSPDGRRVLYTLRSTDLAANKGRTDLWSLDLGRRGAKPVQLTADPADDGSAQWSADGSQIFFLSNRSGIMQVWRAPAGGGAALQVTQSPLDIGTFRLSPRGDRLLISAEVFPDCDLVCSAARLKKRDSHVASGVLQQRLFARHWDSWSDGRRSQLFSLALDAKSGALGPAVLLSAGLDGDVPGKPFGGREDYAFSPDGGTVVFSMRVAPGSEPWSTNFDLYAVPAAGGAAPRNLTAGNVAADLHPVFSPDGSQLAYLAAERPGFESDRQHLVLMDWESGASRPLTKTWDRSIEDFAWSRDGKSLFGVAHHLGQRPLWLIDAASGRASAITGAGTVESFSVGSDRVIYTAGDLGSPPEVFAVGFTGGRATQLTRVNAELRATRRMGEFEQFSFEGARNDLVYAYLVKPAGFKAGANYPLALLIHGGPQSSMANEWHWRWNAQSFAAAGFAALLIDFHGSTGYGQAFTDSVSQDWGGKPLQDIQKGVDAALVKYKFLDSRRMCALGGSYGGYMVNWIAGAMPDRFACLVSHAGVFDNRSMYYSTEQLWFPEWEFGGPEYESPAGFARHNPVDHVKDWKTPMLVIHGERDYRVPYTQGLSAFTALQRRAIPSEWLLFPDENHWILKPANSMQWYEVVIDWLNRWTAKPAAAAK